MMFNGPDAGERTPAIMPNEEALVKLITDKSIDVAVVAAGQPAPIIANMKPEAQKFIKLLKFDPAHPSSKRPLSIYAPATVRAASYPNLLTEDFTTISVGAFLVTYDFKLQAPPSTSCGSRARCARISRRCRRRAIRNGAK